MEADLQNEVICFKKGIVFIILDYGRTHHSVGTDEEKINLVSLSKLFTVKVVSGMRL